MKWKFKQLNHIFLRVWISSRVWIGSKKSKERLIEKNDTALDTSDTIHPI